MNTSVMIASAVAVTAALCSYSVDAEWKVGQDSLGYKNMFQHDKEAGTSIAIGYDGSEDCTDLRVMFMNYFPAQFIYNLPASSPTVEVNAKTYNFPEIVPSKKSYDEVVSFMYLYVPTDNFMNDMIEDSGTIQWNDGTMSSPATYDNSNFSETLNQVVNRCMEVEMARQAPPKGVEVL
jgi:hypothetical protein